MKYIATVKANGITWKTRHFDNLDSAEEFMDNEFKTREAKGYSLHAIRSNGDVVLAKKELGKTHFVAIGVHEI